MPPQLDKKLVLYNVLLTIGIVVLFFMIYKYFG